MPLAALLGLCLALGLARGRGVLPAALDTYIPAQMQAHGIPGVAVSAVLVDRGEIALDDDVRPYLSDPALVANIPHGVTFVQLLTHTDGFETRLLGSAALTEAELQPLADNLVTYPPRQIHAPGAFLTYGNFAANLAGHLVAEISGQSFEDYVVDNIFAPLGMGETTFEQALPPDVLARVVAGYEVHDGRLVPTPRVLINNAPEGGLRGPLTELTRLMQALLSVGSLNGVQVLSPERAAAMLTPAFSSDPRLPGISLGLFEHWTAGETAFIRDGDGIGVRTRMVLFPAHDFGLLVSYNLGDNALRLDIADALAAALFEDEGTAPALQAMTRSDLAGSYRPLQADTTSFAKSLFLFSQTLLVTQPEDHVIELTTGGLLGTGQSNPFGGFEGTSRWVETAPLLFEAEDGPGRIAFQTDASGAVARLVSGQGYHSPFVRLAWSESLPVQVLLLEVSVGVLVVFVAISVIGLPGRALWRRIRRRPVAAAPRAARAGALFLTVAAALFLLLYFRTIGILYAGGPIADLPSFVFGVSDDMRRALDDMRLALLFGVPLLAVMAIAWHQSWWSRGWRVFASLAALAYGGLLLSATYWNLIGFQV